MCEKYLCQTEIKETDSICQNLKRRLSLSRIRVLQGSGPDLNTGKLCLSSEGLLETLLTQLAYYALL